MGNRNFMYRLASSIDSDDGFSIMMFSLFGGMLLNFVLTAILEGEFGVSVTYLNVIAICLPLIVFMLYYVIKGIDSYINYFVKVATNGEREPKCYIMNKIFDNDSGIWEESRASAFSLVGAILGTLLTVWIYVFTFSTIGVPILIVCVMLFGLHFVALKAYRLVYKTNKALDKINKGD